MILKPDQVAAQNNKLVGINASFIIKGDYDRFPSIKLESITANEFGDVGGNRDANFGPGDRYFKALADAPPPPEGQPVEGASTQTFLESLAKQLGVQQALILQGPQFWAHRAHARAKKRPDRGRVEDNTADDPVSRT